MNEKKTLKKLLKWVTFILLCFPTTMSAQLTVSASAESPMHFANTDDFSAGILTIQFNMPVGKTSAEVEVTLADGIQYVAASETITGGSVALKAGSTNTKPVFTITSTGGTPVTLRIKRKVTKAAMVKLSAGDNFSDAVKLTIAGNTAIDNDNPYKLPIPVFTVQVATSHNNALGTSTQTFTILNGGEGKVKEIYFSIDYPANVTGNRIVYNGATLTQVGTVPAGLPNAGNPLYKATVPAGLPKNGTITISENYTVAKCDPNRQIKYIAYWGADKDNLFASANNAKAININMGTPNIVLDTNNQNTYFEWRDGLCGNTVGTFYVTYENKGTPNGTAYNLKTLLYELLSWSSDREFKPANVNIIDSNGNKIPLPLTGPNGTVYSIDYSNAAALRVAALAGKNIGLTDEDGDGYADDLKVGTKIKICFDWVKNQGIKCLQKGKGAEAFSIQPQTQFQYDDVCKGTRVTSAAQNIRDNTFRRSFDNVSDGSKIPVQLVKNVPVAGYFYAAINFYDWNVRERVKGGSMTVNEHRFRYHVQLPPGVALKNVKYHKTRTYGTEISHTSLSDVPAGGVLDYTTNSRERGYISYEMVLENCHGTGGNITYSLYYLDRIGTTNNFCEIPVVCETKNIPTVCPSPCAANGPVMNRTYVERADNSYGWTDHNMTARVARAAVSAIDRQRALYLDDIEVFAEGTQANISSDNLYYYAAVTSETVLEPKSIKVTIGGATTVLSANDLGVVTRANDASGNYFRWNLTNALPGGNLAANQNFSIVATYQVKSGNVNNEDGTTRQAGDESFFYTLANKNDTAINAAKALHTNARVCGTKLVPTFYIADTRTLLATNNYDISGCEEPPLGDRLIYSSRRLNTDGTFFNKEFRPGRLIKKITIKMPLAYSITQPIVYEYLIKAQSSSVVKNSINIPVADFQVTEEGNFRVYTYVNKPEGQAGHLPPGMISVKNEYSEWIQAKIQASCKARERRTFNNNDQAAAAAGERIDSHIEFEDFYYHYRGTTEKQEMTDYLYNRPIRYINKPSISIQSGAYSVKAIQREQQLEFQLKSGLIPAPNAWVSIPDATGISIVKLEELSGAGGSVVNTYTPEASLANEKMFFLNQTINNAGKYFRLTYDVTNCSFNKLPFELHAGWNCSGNPTRGYQEACSDDKKNFEVIVAKTYKQITPATTNPGQGGHSNTIPMCTATPYSYVINSADEGNIYDVKLVVTQGAGITFSDVQIEYPLNSGTIYTVGTGANKIIYSQNGNKHIYDLSAVLPNGALKGTLSAANGNERQLKLTFKVTPDCDFSAGSSFNIEVDGNNLCGKPALGDRSSAIIAGINNVNINDYKIALTPFQKISGNGSVCSAGVTYRTRLTINAITNPSSFETGTNGRLRFRIPQGYELLWLNITQRSAQYNPPAVVWANPNRQTAEERMVGNEYEVVVNIPQKMKNADWFDYDIRIRQKADALLGCDAPKELKAFATGSISGVMCGATACPSFVVSTSPERTITIDNERPSLSFTDVKVTSKALSGKEELSIKYKITNAATASATLSNKPVVVNLYYDVNNNGLVDAADTLVATHTTATLNLTAGATSAEQSFTHLTDASQVCRLLLVIKNENNVCLCDDVNSTFLAPTPIEGLTQSFTICETSSLTLAYPAAAATYTGYNWTAVSPADATNYLSAANVATPTFLYNGAKLTTTLTVTYAFKVRRNHGCEATQTVTVVVTPQTMNFTPPTPLVVSCNNTAGINTWLNSATATDSCGNVMSITNDYNAVKPADPCNAPNGGVVTVTFVAKDPNGNTLTKTSTITLVNIKAENDTFTVTHGAVATTTTNTVLDNDKVGTQTATVGTVSLSVTIPASGVAGSATPTLNSNGTVTVPAGTASGTYQIGYKICKTVAAVTVCDTATATVVVGAVPITTVGEEYTVMGTITTPTTVGNILTNDGIGGQTPTVASVTIHTATPTSATTPRIDPSTGNVIIPTGTPSGTYTMTYYLCERANSSNCSTPTTVTVTVVGVSTPTAPINIVANPDGTVTIRTTTGGMVTSVLTNDTLEGLPVTIGTVSLTWTTATPTGFTLNNDGTISVASNTAVGFYTVSYTICATRGSDRACATSFVEVRVVSDVVTPTIEANGDTFTYTGTQLVGNILTNDKLNGVPNPSVNSVTISTSTPTTGNVPFINPSTGEVMVPPYTPSGTYTINYNVCVKGVSICSTASVVVIVPPTPTPTPTVVPVAVNDSAATPRNTPVTIDVLSNDTPNGATTPNVVTTPQNGTAVVNPNGTIEYTPNTGFKGVDTFVYELCNADGCATATVSIEVTHKLIVYNGISVGGDKNNHFHIAGIEAYPNNTVRIYNRWGVKVWEVQSYDNVRNVFKGISNGRVTIEAADKLPQGTYYYVIEYVDENNQQQSMVGWLYLKK